VCPRGNSVAVGVQPILARLRAADAASTARIEDVSHPTATASLSVLGGAVSVEQLGELVRPTQRRAVSAVDLVGHDPETVTNQGLQPLDREESVVSTQRLHELGCPAKQQVARARPGCVRLAPLVGQRLFGELWPDIVIEHRNRAATASLPDAARATGDG
jgi:hypothetical protein